MNHIDAETVRRAMDTCADMDAEDSVAYLRSNARNVAAELRDIANTDPLGNDLRRLADQLDPQPDQQPVSKNQ